MGLSLAAVRESLSRPTEDALRALRQERRELTDRLAQVDCTLAMLEAVQAVIGVGMEEPVPASRNGNGTGRMHTVDERDLPTFAAHGCDGADEAHEDGMGSGFYFDPRD